MAVYKRNYRTYSGPVNPPRWRWLVITRYSLAELFASRISTLLFVLCLTPTLVFALIIYVVNSTSLQALMGFRGPSPLAINNRFFFTIMQVQAWLALFLTAWVGPAMVSPDLTNGALPLYLSRPISRAEYVGGKLLVLAIILSAVTWVPGLVLFGIQSQVSTVPWLWSNLYIAEGIVAGSLIWVALLSLLALAMSAWVRWRIVATGLMVAVIFIPAGFGAVVSEVLRTKWGLLLNLPYLVTLQWSHLLGLGRLMMNDLPVTSTWVMMLGACALSLAMLAKRVKARQVVRG